MVGGGGRGTRGLRPPFGVRCRQHRRRSPRSWLRRPTATCTRSRSQSAPLLSAAAHRSQGQPSPCESLAIAAVLVGIRRARRMRPQRKAQALELEPLARIIERIDTEPLAGLRDHALLLLGFAAALRHPSWSRSTRRSCASTRFVGCSSASAAPRPIGISRASSSPSRTRRPRTGARSAPCAATSTQPASSPPGVPADAPRRQPHRSGGSQTSPSR